MGRQFFYIWTVNWRLIPEDLFLNRYFHLSLLLIHIIVLLYVCRFQWLDKNVRNLKELLNYHQNFQLSDDTIVTMMFYSNFIGICFCRSLHYQFYVWYYHMLYHLLWSTNSYAIVKLVLLLMPFRLGYFAVQYSCFSLVVLLLIEFAWNTYPSTVISSLILHICHGYLLIKLITSLKIEGNKKKVKKMK